MLAHRLKQAVEFGLGAGKGRSKLQAVAAEAHVETGLPQLHANFKRAHQRIAVTRGKLDGTGEAATSDVNQ